MNTKTVNQHLNRALSLEYGAVVQYNQYSALIMGTDRQVYEGFFNDSSTEARTHAKKVADWVVSLGGVPTVEVAPVRQTTSIQEMLEQALEVEQGALQAYRDAHAATDDDAPIRFMLEEQIMLEQEDVWEIQKYLSQLAVKLSASDRGQKAG